MLTDFQWAVLLHLINRMAVYAIGTFCIWIGYRLYRLRITTANDCIVKLGTTTVGGEKIRPGTLFGFFGAALISTMIIQGLYSGGGGSRPPQGPNPQSPATAQ